MASDVEKYLEEFNIHLTPPDDFDFPFTPYDIQKEFMEKLYFALENSKLGIFESPTGTGKSLSLICGALSWLRDHEDRLLKQLEGALSDLNDKRSAANDESNGDWLTAQIKQASTNNAFLQVRHKVDKINRNKKRIADIRDRAKTGSNLSAKRLGSNTGAVCSDELVKENLDDCDILLDNVSDGETSDEEEEDNVEDPPVKIIFCSRTHSQLSQFVGEVQRTIFSNFIRVVPMGSRQNCCINKSVNKLKSLSLMNEKCLEMLKNSDKNTSKEDGKVTKKTKKSGSCPHLKNVNALTEVIISQVLDLENIVKKGEQLSSCPYYATRSATADSQVVVVPYNTLLHKSTRESSKLQIKNAVVIVDEAHNLLETVTHIHSSEVTGQQFTFALSQLSQYKTKFESRFSSKNLLCLSQLIFVLKSLVKFISDHSVKTSTESDSDPVMFSVSDFILSVGIDNYNIFKLVDFCNKNKIIHKIRGFTEKYQPTVNPKPKVEPPKKLGMKSFLQEVSSKKKVIRENIEEKPTHNEEKLDGQPLIPTLAFLSNLTMDYREGRIVMKKSSTLGKSVVKYLLLDPSSVMEDIIREARSVILAGGTMKPFAEFRDRLFLACGADESRIMEFSCGHVIPKENILPIISCSGPSGQVFDFSFQKRNSESLKAEVGRLLVNVCSVVPAGVVVFFPSYDYEKIIYDYLTTHDFIKKISTKKKLLREPKTSGEVDVVLKDFAESARNKSLGAILFSVVGGKLSEGLNFSDELGRCVIVVGMPYPNIKSPELKEKMDFLNKTAGPQAGREYYENCCMKAVNQCIGRAVRHRNDYSSVLLLDHRYKSQNHIQLLPEWIAKSLQIHEKIGPVLGQLAKFFRDHKVSG